MIVNHAETVQGGKISVDRIKEGKKGDKIERGWKPCLARELMWYGILPGRLMGGRGELEPSTRRHGGR